MILVVGLQNGQARSKVKLVKLSRGQLVELAKKSISNANALVTEAELLFQAKHWARTAFLCHTAGEEFGKSIVCMSATMDVARGVIDWKKFWKRFLNHHAKAKAIDVFETMILGDPDPLEDYFAKLDENTAALFEGRNLALYTAAADDGTVWEPSEGIPENMATDALKWAKGRSRLVEDAIVPLLNSKVMRASDAELRKMHGKFIELMKNPVQLEKFAKGLTAKANDESVVSPVAEQETVEPSEGMAE
jgi:AbiV family abortive infection protein